MLIVIEPKTQSSSLVSFRLKLGFSQAISVCNDHICIFWRDSVLQLEAERIGVHNHSLRLRWLALGDVFWFTAFYGLHSVVARCLLWDDLISFYGSLTAPWFVGGGFNTFRTWEEHKGRSSTYFQTLQDFNDCLSACELQSINYQGSPYTWCDGRGLGSVWRHLDRFVCSQDFFDSFSAVHYQHLNRLLQITHHFISLVSWRLHTGQHLLDIWMFCLPILISTVLQVIIGIFSR